MATCRRRQCNSLPIYCYEVKHIAVHIARNPIHERSSDCPTAESIFQSQIVAVNNLEKSTFKPRYYQLTTTFLPTVSRMSMLSLSNDRELYQSIAQSTIC